MMINEEAKRSEMHRFPVVTCGSHLQVPKVITKLESLTAHQELQTTLLQTRRSRSIRSLTRQPPTPLPSHLIRSRSQLTRRTNHHPQHGLLWVQRRRYPHSMMLSFVGSASSPILIRRTPPHLITRNASNLPTALILLRVSCVCCS